MRPWTRLLLFQTMTPIRRHAIFCTNIELLLDWHSRSWEKIEVKVPVIFTLENIFENVIHKMPVILSPLSVLSFDVENGTLSGSRHKQAWYHALHTVKPLI